MYILSQCYSMVNMKVIRNNLNMITIFKQNKHYTKFVYNEFVGNDTMFVKCIVICNNCWPDYSFLVIYVILNLLMENIWIYLIT